MKNICLFFSAFLFILSNSVCAQESPEALLIIKNSKKAYDKNFSKFLEENSVRITQAWPPCAYFAYVPKEKDEIIKKNGILIYREKINDWTSLGEYGDKAVLAANLWNKRFVQDPPKAPLPISLSVTKNKGEIQILSWNEVMKACGYKIQISKNKDFSEIYKQTALSSNSYLILPSFWPDGIYYWRVSALLCLNSGENRESGFSQISNFASPFKTKKENKRSPKNIKVFFSSDTLSWSDLKSPYYRVKISDADRGEVMEFFTDKNSYYTSDLLETGRKYIAEVETTDGFSGGYVYGPVEVKYSEK